MRPIDRYELYQLYDVARETEGFYNMSKKEKALFLELNEEFYQENGRMFSEDDYERFRNIDKIKNDQRIS